MGKKCFDARLIDAPPALRADQYICQFEMPEGRHPSLRTILESIQELVGRFRGFVGKNPRLGR
jgi:hypothetical protein